MVNKVALGAQVEPSHTNDPFRPECCYIWLMVYLVNNSYGQYCSLGAAEQSVLLNGTFEDTLYCCICLTVHLVNDQ